MHVIQKGPYTFTSNYGFQSNDKKIWPTTTDTFERNLITSKVHGCVSDFTLWVTTNTNGFRLYFVTDGMDIEDDFCLVF